MDTHNQPLHLHQQQTAVVDPQEQFAAAAAAAAAIRQQLGAAFNFAGAQSFLGQLTAGQQASQNQNHTHTHPSGPTNNNPTTELNLNNIAAANNVATSQLGTNASALNQTDLMKQQEQFLAALMTAATNNQQHQHQAQQQHQQQTAINNNPSATNNGDQQATRSALSMMASNAMLIAAPNAPDAIAMANAAQALGAKGAFVILLL